MEGTVFLDPAVAGTMKEHFVEARLHTDTQNTLTDAQFADNRAAQKELAGTLANPYFVVVDPKTGKKISEHALSGGPSAWTPGWIEFLADTLKQAAR
jgi:hypothetical protein